MDRDAALSWVAGEFTKRLAGAVAGMAGTDPMVELEPTAEVASGADWLWWRQPFTGLSDALVWVGAPENAWLMIGTAALAGAGLDDASPEDCRGTYLELLQQAISGLAGALTARIGREILPDSGKEGPPGQGGPAASIKITVEGHAEPGQMALVLSRSFPDALQLKPDPPAAVPVPSPSPVPEGGADDRYELLLDVEMPVSVSFGRAHLALRDVVKLTSGAIVELNRAVSEPVELIVNNCVIAKGEVVVVDGNYGVRIKQIISRRERLRTLH